MSTKKYKIGMDFSKNVPENEKILASIGGYQIVETDDELKIYGAKTVVLNDVINSNLIYSPAVKEGLKFMENEWELEENVIYHVIKIPIRKENEEFLAIYVFNDLNTALNFLGSIANYYRFQINLFQKKMKKIN